MTTTDPGPSSAASELDEDNTLSVDGPPGNGLFDGHHPPPDELISDCVHCGFCLPACPTYSLWGEEMDSPRGRIYLMKLGKEGAAEPDDTYAAHFDSCLGCLACVSACPSGVQYDKLIEATRPQLERLHRRHLPDRLLRAGIFAVFPYPARLRVAAIGGLLYRRWLQPWTRRSGLLDRLPPSLQAMERLLPSVSLRGLLRRAPIRTAPSGPLRRRVGLLTGCAQRVFFGDVNAATVRVLAAEGCEVVAPAAQRCCGALSLHAGREPEALDRARALIEVFETEGLDEIIVNVAGCGSAMKDYGHLLRDDPAWAERAAAFSSTVRDVSEFLADLEAIAPRHAVEGRVAYHDACHLAHGQGVRDAPRELLTAIPGLEVVGIPEQDMCCGSAGVYNLVQPKPAQELGRRKVQHVLSTHPDALVTGNAGCLLQIGAYLDADIPLLHPIQLVDASIRGADPIQAAQSHAVTATLES